MSLSVVCECGQQYQVGSEAAGAVFKCDNCGRRLLAGKDEPAPELTPKAQQRILKEVQSSQRITGTKASNPAVVEVSRWRVICLNPWLFGFYYALFLIPLAFYGRSLVGEPFPLFNLGLFCALTFGLWLISEVPFAVIATQFKSGDTNSSKIVDINSGLVAVYTDLRHRPDDRCPVIKVLHQPIGHIIDGPAELGRRVISVSYYCPGHKALDHWVDFRPRLINAVARSTESVDRLMSSISESEWQILDIGISQIPKPYTPGLYRIYSLQQIEYVEHRGKIDEAKIFKVIEYFLSGLSRVRIAPDKRTATQALEAFNAPIDHSVAAITSLNGMVFTTSACYGNDPTGEQFVFQWSDVLGALYTDGKVRITLCDLTNVTVKVSYWHAKFGVMLEKLCTTIGRL